MKKIKQTKRKRKLNEVKVARNKKILALEKKGKSIETIAGKFNMSKERIRQIVIDENKGQRTVVSSRYIAKVLQKRRSKLPHSLLHTAVKDVIKRDKGIKKYPHTSPALPDAKKSLITMYTVRRSDVTKIVKLSLKSDYILNACSCIDCGKNTHSVAKKRCDKCTIVWDKNRSKRNYTQFKSGKWKPKPTKPWITESITLLQKHKVNVRTETWLTLSQATKRGGFKGQVSLMYLRGQKLLKTRTDKKKKWRGKPISFFAQSQMDIIRQVREGLGLI